MALIYNNTEVKKLYYNGTEIKEAYYNGTKVYGDVITKTIPISLQRFDMKQSGYYSYYYPGGIITIDEAKEILSISPNIYSLLIYTNPNRYLDKYFYYDSGSNVIRHTAIGEYFTKYTITNFSINLTIQFIPK